MTDLDHIHSRLDKQDELLREIHEKLIDHMAREEQIRSATEELVILWKGSKIIIPILAASAAALAGAWAWFKGNVHL